MVSREQKKAVMCKKQLQLLRSITNSNTNNRTSIVLNASTYIHDLKQKIERRNDDIAMAHVSSSTGQSPSPLLRVEAQENSFLIKVFNESSCRGLLLFILEAFEDLGLDVLHARVSCSDNFLLEAVGTKNLAMQEDKAGEQIDAQKIEQALLQAIESWSEVSDQ